MDQQQIVRSLREAIPGSEIQVFPRSVAETEGGNIFLYAEVDGYPRLLCSCAGDRVRAFSGAVYGDWLVCGLTHGNRVALNHALDYTAPCAMGRAATTIGLGDRLGLVGSAQLAAIEGTGLKPILAQQSMREMHLTGRTFEDVQDAASYAVFRSGWRGGWGADGDHLKNEQEIAEAVAAGCTMITLDCSAALHLQTDMCGESEEACYARYAQDEARRALGLPLTREQLAETRSVYNGAVELIKRVWFDILLPAGRPIDLEISLDETTETTGYFAHYYVANELMRAGVIVNSLAPKFVGEFHKGVDYRGELEDFSANFAMHCRIADQFGYKISVHSGSDKFSVFPLIGALSGGRFHLKTSGTNWLAAIRVLAEKEPALFRRMVAAARAHFDEARQYYEVHASLSRVPDIDALPDDALPALFDAVDSRQMLHITYGFLIAPDAPLHDEIFAALHAHREAVDAAVTAHIGRHVASLGMQKRAFRPRLCLTLTKKIIGSAPFLYEGDFCEGVRRAAALGYDCVEIHVANPDELELVRLREALSETGVAVSALGTGRVYVNDGLSLIDDDPAKRGAALERLKRFIDAAKTLHCIVIIGCLRGNIPAPERYGECISRLAESVREADAYAHARGVTLVFEPINRYENNFLCNAEETVSFIRESGLKSTKVLFDAFHMNIEEADPLACIARYAPYIGYFHAADSNRLTPGEGHTDFASMFALLAEHGYRGDVSAECLPLPTKERAAQTWIRNVKALLAAL